MARQTIQPPPAQPPRYSLLLVAPPAAGDDPQEWVQGWQFAPEGCGESGRAPATWCAPGEELDVFDRPATAEGDPFVVYVSDRCSSLSFFRRDFEGRARRQLEATQSFQVANELWTGELSAAQGLANIPLTSPTSDTVTSGALAPVEALGRLVGGLATCAQGQRGMIHVTPQLLSSLFEAGAIRRDGGFWLDAMDNIVVADAGYTGSGPGNTPATATQWAYATTMIRTRLSPVMIQPGSVEQALDPYTNTITYWAQRLAGYEWNECCHLAAEVALPVPLVGPPS